MQTACVSVGSGISSYVCLHVAGTDLDAHWRNWLYWFPAGRRARQLGDRDRETFL